MLIYSVGKSQMQMHIDTPFLIETTDLIIFCNDLAFSRIPMFFKFIVH